MPVIHGDSPAAEPTSCAGCGSKIVDRYYLLAVDRQWHSHCLKCCECKLRLDSELTCFSRDGNIYCKEDYYRLFAVKRCGRCHLGISANELVMRARDLVYHLHCFNCASCNKALTKGEQFGMKENMVYCRLHYEVLVQSDYSMTELDSVYRTTAPTTGRMPYYNGVGTVQKGRPRKRKTHDHTEVHHSITGLGPSTLELLPNGSDLCSLEQTSGTGYDTTPPPPSGGNSQHGPRTKRMRTSFKHHQLRTMKSYFALNQNPDAKDLKQLAQKTGLSKRVLQVWFQNARAKWRRNMMRQENQTGDKSSGDSCPGGGQGGIGDLGSSGSHLGSDHPLSSTPTSMGGGDIPPGALTSESQSPHSLTFGDLY